MRGYLRHESVITAINQRAKHTMNSVAATTTAPTGLDKRLFVIAIIISALAITFWAGSRVPALNEKAAMGTEIDMTTLGFDIVFQAEADDPVFTKIIYTTINWAATNKKGMTFGVLFASCLMTLFTILKKRNFKGNLSNSALGVMIGAPLGVCVNCAAPIAQGMSARGARLETTLATMMSSPTMNFVVVGMLFSMLPIYLVAIKFAFTLGIILVVVPLLARFVLGREVEQSMACALPAATSGSCPIPEPLDPLALEAMQRWTRAFIWISKEFAKNLWYMIKMTVPLMLLAGFLGSALITVLPWESLADIFPAYWGWMGLASLMGVALVGTFLPVPIAFDVLISVTLLAAGMPVKYVMVLLFTLGIYSIYSASIVWQAISKRTAVLLFMAVACFGVLAGYTGQYFYDKSVRESMEFLVKYSVDNRGTKEPSTLIQRSADTDASESEMPTESVRAIALPAAHVTVTSDANVRVERTAFRPQQNPATTPFTKMTGEEIGLDVPYRFSFLKMNLPFEQGHGRTVASGDVNDDGWSDILFVSELGLLLYMNNEGKNFVQQRLQLPEIQDKIAVNAALVDLNNDGWLDIFVSTYRHGDFMIINHKGSFQASGLQYIPTDDEHIMTTTFGFGDIDRDGDLDAIIGKWSVAMHGDVKTSDISYNAVLINESGQFTIDRLPVPPGAPTTVLITDYNSDGHTDLIIGNDFKIPDYYLTGDGNGKFSSIQKQDNMIPHSSTHTMSIVAGDINNDLTQEIFIADKSQFPRNDPDHQRLTNTQACDTLDNEAHKQTCMQDAALHEVFSRVNLTKDYTVCDEIEDDRYRDECTIIYFVLRPRNFYGDLCNIFPASWETTRSMCNTHMMGSYKPSLEEQEKEIPQVKDRNVLLVSNDDKGSYVDRAIDFGLELGGWAWTSKFADFDNDEWQDLYVVNGTALSSTRLESNYFFHNQEGRKFQDRTKEFGLGSYRPTTSSSYVDFDNDGDIDIVTIPVNAPVEVYRNNQDSNNAIAFELRDKTGNAFGIGSRLIIHYGDNGERHQLRELMLSGGKGSFDAPVAHVGLGSHENVSRVEILWSTGERSEISGNFTAGARYRITRMGSTKTTGVKIATGEI
jgi:uncharacterized membrane protein YraQ (UPF0718 family)